MSLPCKNRLTALLASALLVSIATTSHASYHTHSIVFMTSTVGQAVTEQPSHLWLEYVESGSNGIARLRFSFSAHVLLTGPQVLQCGAESAKDIGSSRLEFTLVDSNDHVLQSGESELSGDGYATFEWDPRDLDDGEYKILCTLSAMSGAIIAWADFHVTKLCQATVENSMDAATEKVVLLDERLIQLAEDSRVSPYVTMRLAVAKDFLELARAKSKDLRRSYHIARYALSTVESIRGELALDTLRARRPVPAPAVAMSNLKLRNGAFYADQRPVFLAGMKGLTSPESDLPRLAKYGLNLAVVEQGSLGEGTDDTQSLDSLFAAAKASNVSVTYVLSHLESVLTQFDDIDSDLASYLSSRDMLNSLSIASAPTFSLGGEEVRQGFIEHVRSIYEDRFELNRAWRTRLVDFSEIQIWSNIPRASYQYDWQSYQRGLVTRYYSDLVSKMHAAHPKLRLQVTFGDDTLERGESRSGIAREPLSKIFDVQGIGGSSSLSDRIFAMRYPGHTMNYALLRSFAPDKPIFAIHDIYFENGAHLRRDIIADMRSFVWESAMEGVNALALGVWDCRSEPYMSYLSTPEGLEGFAGAAIDLNRLGTLVEAFQNAPAPIALLWSDSAKMYDTGDPYLASAQRAYEGVSFGGFKVRFITETQLSTGDTDGIEVLIIPDTPALSREAFVELQELAGANLTIIRAATPIPYDSWGHSRKDVISYGLATRLVRGRDASTEYLHALDAVLSDGRIPQTPRAINRYGYPLEGVKTRSIDFEGDKYLYLINLRKDTVLCHILGDYTSGYDLIGQREMRFPNLVKPLQPLLIRLNPAEREETLARDGGAEFDASTQGTTRVLVRPVRPSSD